MNLQVHISYHSSASLQVVMNPPRICPHCGSLLGDRFKLHRHMIDMHNPHFCLFCNLEEGSVERLKKRITKKHPTVCLEALEGPLFRWKTDPIRDVPTNRPRSSPSCRHPNNTAQSSCPPAKPAAPAAATFPTPPNYSPYQPEVVETPWEYVPTPAKSKASSTSEKLTTPEWEILDELEASLPDLISSTEKASPKSTVTASTDSTMNEEPQNKSTDISDCRH